jgi:flagellar hook-length control protein FliK
MENLQLTAPVAPAAPVAGSKGATADTAAEGDAQSWLAAFQAALTPGVKGLKLASIKGATATDPAEATDAAAGSDDKTAAETALTAGAMSLPLLATLPPAPPATTATGGDAKPARGADALATTSRAVNTDTAAAPQTNTGHDTARSQHGAPDAAASPDAMARLIEQAAAREGNGRDAGRDAMTQSAAPFALAHATPAANAPTAPQAAQLHVNATVGSAAWGAELGQKVVWMIGEKQHVAELHVNPPDLGPLDIKLTISDNNTTAVFTSPHGTVRDAVESALPRLREVLAESGIQLGNASVTSDTPQDGSAFATQQEQARRGNGVPQAADSTAAGAAQPVASQVTRRNGLVDLFA